MELRKIGTINDLIKKSDEYTEEESVEPRALYDITGDISKVVGDLSSDIYISEVLDEETKKVWESKLHKIDSLVIELASTLKNV